MAKSVSVSDDLRRAVQWRMDKLRRDMVGPEAKRIATLGAVKSDWEAKTGIRLTAATVGNMANGVVAGASRETVDKFGEYLGESPEDWIAMSRAQVATPPQRTTELDERYPVVAIVLDDARRSGWREDDIGGARVRLSAFKGQPSEDDVWHALRASRSGRLRGVTELEATKTVEAAEREPNLKPATKRGKR